MFKQCTQRMQKAQSVPYWWRDNQKFVERVLEIEKRRKEYERFLKDVNYTDVYFNEKTGGLKATHRLHNFNKETGKYEKQVQDLFFQNGDKIVLASEDSTIQSKKIDGHLNDVSFDISTIIGTGNDTIKRALKHTIEKKAEIAILYYTENTFDIEKLYSGIRKFKGLKLGNFKSIIYIVDNEIKYLQ